MHLGALTVHVEALNNLAAPSFPQALCRGRADLFDAAAGRPNRTEVQHARALALAICAQCPCLQRCSDWVDSLHPWQQPHGVVVGRVVTKKSAHTPW